MTFVAMVLYVDILLDSRFPAQFSSVPSLHVTVALFTTCLFICSS